MKNLKANDFQPLAFSTMIRAAKINSDTQDRLNATRELNEVPEEVMADIEVRETLAKVSPEVREKIIKGLPF
jgi:hypothetical protein